MTIAEHCWIRSGKSSDGSSGSSRTCSTCLDSRPAQPNPDLSSGLQISWSYRHSTISEDRTGLRSCSRPSSPLVSVDAPQVERALANLLDNALRFSPAGEPVQVHVTATRKELIIRVVDHGPGIDESELERIFEPFHRAQGLDDHRGAGLGLAIARGFASANGGRVWAESQLGQGASFALALPAVEAPARVRA